MCTTGIISLDYKTEKTGEIIFESGIIPSSSDVNTYCANSAFKDPANCSSLIDQKSLRELLMERCVGKPECMLNNLGRFIDTSTKSNPLTMRECFSKDASLLIKVGCMLPEDDLQTRKELELAFGCFAVFVTLFVINYLDFV